MFNYRTPDVYIREESGGARPIQPVGTSTPGFVGVAPYAKAHREDASATPVAVAVNNWSQFVREFCVAPDADDPDSPEALYASTALSHAVYGFFLNGGSRCYVVNVGNLEGAKPAEDDEGNKKPKRGAKTKKEHQGIDAADALPPVKEGLDVLAQYDDVAIVVAPGYLDKGSQGEVVAHCEDLADRVAILDVDAPDLKPDDVNPGSKPSYTMPQSKRGYGAVYYPWIAVRDPLDRTSQEPVMVGPSGHIAGVWARTDATRGVHKAPANEPLRGALSLGYRLTREEQGSLNSAGINCIRHFTREGIRVWGARTIASDPEWRYLNVRRLFNMIEESIAESTRWTVFEPNDQTLWKSIQRDVGAFLTNIWRGGALQGATPEQAFFVKCDAETNPQDVIDAGYVVTIVGIAPVKPAEFVLFRIRQSAGTAQTEGE